MRRLRSMLRFCVAVTVCLALIPTHSWTQEKAEPELLVAAAADLNPALHDIAQQYEKKTRIRIKLSFGASGALTQQIENGAPFDLFFSADMDYPKHLIADGQADAPSLYQYSLGQLVLWVPASSPLDVERQGMAVLLDSSVKKIAIANPEHAPYRSEEHTSELQSLRHLVCRLLLEKKKRLLMLDLNHQTVKHI